MTDNQVSYGSCRKLRRSMVTFGWSHRGHFSARCDQPHEEDFGLDNTLRSAKRSRCVVVGGEIECGWSNLRTTINPTHLKQL